MAASTHFPAPGSLDSGHVYQPPSPPMTHSSLFLRTAAPKRKRVNTMDSLRDHSNSPSLSFEPVQHPFNTARSLLHDPPRLLDESMYTDLDYRRALGPYCVAQPNIMEHSPSRRDGWSRLALDAIGGVVGRVWQFCTAVPFRGFIAGGGQAYSPTGNPRTTPSPYAGRYVEQQSPSLAPAEHESPDPRPVKRRQVSENYGDLRNWVMVDQPQISRQIPRPTSRANTARPRASVASNRRISVPVSRIPASSASSAASRRQSRVSYGGSPNLASTSTASFATPRAIPSPEMQMAMPPVVLPSSPPESPSRIPKPVPSLNTHTTPAPRRQGVSTGMAVFTPRPKTTSPRKKRTSINDIKSSPHLNDEAKQLATSKLMVEQDTNMRMSNFNATLQELIRQGQDALNTPASHYDDMDEGFTDFEANY